MSTNILTTGLALRGNLGKSNSSNSYTQDELRKLEGKLLSARVIGVDQSNTSANGNITVQFIQELELNGSDIVSGVLPLFPNLKNYPLVNEVVLIIPLASKEYKNDFNSPVFYYLSPLNLWNNNQTNPIPYPKENILPDTQTKGYAEVEATNNPNKPSKTNNTIFKPGVYFNDSKFVNPTFPYEGDYIIDGRFGNSLRFGNTVPNGILSTSNNWSTVGELGDPITILTNEKHTQDPYYNSITEDINKDGSSMYFTSTQKIPIEVSSQNDYLSYGDTKPIAPKEYTGPQVILNSGRLLLNSTQDHIMLSSRRSINLNSLESVNIDARSQTVIQTPELYLGGKNESQPIVLGDELVDLLKNILDDLSSLTNTLGLQVNAYGIPLEPTSGKARIVASNIAGYKTQLSDLLSKTTKTV